MSEDRREKYERRMKGIERLKSSAQIMSAALKLEMPELVKEEEVTPMTIGMNDFTSKEGKDSNLGPWEDEECKAFYEHILDLANQVPAILLGSRYKAGSDVTTDANVDTAIPSPDKPVVEIEEEDVEPLQAGDDVLGEDKTVDAGTQGVFSSIVTRLGNALNRDLVDQLSVEFAFINGKGTRRKISQVLLGVSRQRLDLLPMYSRFIAILNIYMPDVGITVVEEVILSFSSLVAAIISLSSKEKRSNIY
jgi:regulator of nonsense transcripts 2